jgi:two-component sensor histidine kinase
LMIRELAAEYGVSDRVEIEIRTADMAVAIDQAVPLVLIANEPAASALEHAFPGDARRKICVGLSYAREPAEGSDPADGYGVLEVVDDGVPLRPSFAFEAAESTGFYLVRTLTSQLQARMTVAEHASGKTFRLSFPIGN